MRTAMASLGLTVLAIWAVQGAVGQKPPNALTNEGIVALTEAGLPASAIVARIGIAPSTDFDTAEAPPDGRAWLSGDCELRVLRGGSWDVFPRYQRSAARDRRPSGIWLTYVGFRVARTLTP